MSALKKLVSALLVLTLAVSGGLLAWHGLHRTSAAPPAGQTQTPAVPAPPEAVPDTVSTLCVAGDLVMHIPIINSCRTDDGYDFTGLFDEARPYYESADYAAACIETTFNGPPYSGFPQFCAPDQLAGDLKSVGLDLLSTASNHSLDTWFSGLTRTLDVLDEAGLDHVGTYRTQEERDSVKVVDVGGIRLAFLAYTYGTNGLPKDEHPYCVNIFTTDYMTNCSEIDYDLLKSDLARARQTDADAIAVFMHWGQEYATSPSAQQRELADFLFENGATLVLGGHVHVPQPMELRELPDGRTGFLCYCLGNLISNQHDRYTNLTAAVSLELTKDSETGAVTVSDAEYVPMYMLHPDASADGRYHLLDLNRRLRERRSYGRTGRRSPGAQAGSCGRAQHLRRGGGITVIPRRKGRITRKKELTFTGQLSFFAVLSGIVIGNVELLEVADLLRTDVHFLADILHRHAALVHHDHHVIEYVVDLTDELLLVAVLGGDDGLRALLAYLLEDLVDALLEQVAGVRALLRLCATLCDDSLHLLKRIHILLSFLLLVFFPQRREKAGAVACVADRTLGRADIDQRIIVTVGQDLLHKNEIARGLALVPQLLARAREKPRRAGIHRQLKRLLVRIAEHEHLAAALILTDDRDERRFHEKLA